MEKIFRDKVFKMLIAKGKITYDLADILMKRHHSGFSVSSGSRIQPEDEEAVENLARCIVRASFSQEKMTPYAVRGRLYIPGEAKVLYRSKACPRPRSGNRKRETEFDAPVSSTGQVYVGPEYPETLPA